MKELLKVLLDKGLARPFFNLTILLCAGLFIVACQGDKSQAAGGAEPKPVVVTPPKLPVNPLLNCGDWQLDLPFNLPVPLPAEASWVIMGSSSAFGAGATAYQFSWAGLLASDALTENADIFNISRGGHTTYHALSEDCIVDPKRPAADPAHNIDRALALKPDLVILSYPSNDAASSFAAVESAANILLIRWQLALARVPVVVLSAQPRALSSERQRLLVELDNWLKPLIGPCFVDVYPLLLGSAGKLAAEYDAGDGVHLTNAGHQQVFNALKKVLQSQACVQFSAVIAAG